MAVVQLDEEVEEYVIVKELVLVPLILGFEEKMLGTGLGSPCLSGVALVRFDHSQESRSQIGVVGG